MTAPLVLALVEPPRRRTWTPMPVVLGRMADVLLEADRALPRGEAERRARAMVAEKGKRET